MSERQFSIVECEQGTSEWFQERCGLLTSSDVADIFREGKKKGEPSVQKRDLRIRLALEGLTGRADEDSVTTKPMQRGKDSERFARLAYEAKTGTVLDTVGFLKHKTLATGASLDAYVDDFVGVVEFKCPKSFTHLEYLREQVIPKDYAAQLRHQVWLAGAEWGDFVSFDDRMPEGGELLILRYVPTEADMLAHGLAVSLFLSEVQAEAKAIAELIGRAA